VTKTAVRLLAGSTQVVEATDAMVRHARLVAATRADHDADAMPAERFHELWAAERAFLRAARAEIGLSPPGR
jgi:hypothetical protein